MKSKLYFGVLLSVTTILAGCQKDADNPAIDRPAATAHTITIRAAKGDDTKTIIHEEAENLFSTMWEAGDRIAILEMVTGESTNPELSPIDDSSGFISSEPLEEGAEIASFKAEFYPYYWEDGGLTEEELATYSLNYCYVAATSESYMLYPQWDEKGLYIPLYLPSMQTIGSNSINTSCDLMVSNYSDGYSSRPDEIEFHFARLGSIVMISVGGLEPGDKIMNGTWHTGKSFLPALDLEAVISYYPQLGEYKYEKLGHLDYDNLHRAINFQVDYDDEIVVGSDGKANIYLRALPGKLDDWFMLECNILRGEEMLTYSKYVSLADLGKSLVFNDSGLTKFGVTLKPATVDNPEHIMYIVPESRNSFTAVWEAQEHVAKYECYYQLQYVDEGVDNPKIELEVIDGAELGMEGMKCIQVENLDPEIYTLAIRSIPESEYGPVGCNPTFMDIYVGVAKYISWNDVAYSGYKGQLTQISDTVWQVLENDSLFPWMFDVANVTTDWGYLMCANSWSFGTSKEMQHPGLLEKISLQISKNETEIPTVYGITSEGVEVEITNPTITSYDNSYNWYSFELEKSGNFNGFRLCANKEMTIYSLSIGYYAPTGLE